MAAKICCLGPSVLIPSSFRSPSVRVRKASMSTYRKEERQTRVVQEAPRLWVETREGECGDQSSSFTRRACESKHERENRLWIWQVPPPPTPTPPRLMMDYLLLLKDRLVFLQRQFLQDARQLIWNR